MTEIEPNPEYEPALDRNALIEGLQGLGVDVQIDDWDGGSDNDVLGHIATLSLMYDLDHEETFAALGIPVDESDQLE